MNIERMIKACFKSNIQDVSYEAFEKFDILTEKIKPNKQDKTRVLVI